MTRLDQNSLKKGLSGNAVLKFPSVWDGSYKSDKTLEGENPKVQEQTHMMEERWS